jgi:tetratricopeptide (TPR) repeat protein
MKRQDLQERYEALGDERDFMEAKPLYEQALAGSPEAQTLLEYGYLLECHCRNELRRAVAQYERAIDLDPTLDKPHYQLISARAGLLETDRSIVDYEKRLAASSGEPRAYRFLAVAYNFAHAYDKALEVIEAGLDLAPDDAALMELRGDAKAGLGDPDGALADWRTAVEREPESIGGLYSTAFLLERENRMSEAVEAWESIVEWNESRGFALQAEWPKRELDRVRRDLG